MEVRLMCDELPKILRRRRRRDGACRTQRQPGKALTAKPHLPKATVVSQRGDTASLESRAASKVKQTLKPVVLYPSGSPHRSRVSVEAPKSTASATTKCSQAGKGSKLHTSVPVSANIHRHHYLAAYSTAPKDESQSPQAVVGPSESTRVSSLYGTAVDALFHPKASVKTAAPDISWQTSGNAAHTPPTRNTRNQDECSEIRHSSLLCHSSVARKNAWVREVVRDDLERFTTEDLVPVQNAAITTIAFVTIPPGSRFPRVPFMSIREPWMSVAGRPPEPHMAPGSDIRMPRIVQPTHQQMLAQSQCFAQPTFSISCVFDGFRFELSADARA
ncbi:hypothetical protein HPB51_002272 [Rhipicephalus microplus]|uniref:Uncharacterized protein n=1 Tax=Rhipicephalus microplus TaxID=6941 RepID=A0A9J6DYF2_RHIMP|nr:hypothetical protein HPB51_002272 [Rhipicephalus microplus]